MVMERFQSFFAQGPKEPRYWISVHALP